MLISRKNLILLFATLSVTIGQSVDIYLSSMPSMVAAFNTTTEVIQLTITIAFIAYGATALIYGPLSDYFGRRIIALVGLIIFIAGSIGAMCATNIYWLLLGRVLQGIGFASACGVSAPSISDTFSGSELTKAYSYTGMTMAITPIVAPLLGGYLQSYFNWHAPFVFLFLYSVLLFILFYKYFPETNQRRKQSSIHPLHIIKNYCEILSNAKYLKFVACAILVYSGEILYVITAPFLLQTQLGVTPIQNGWLILLTVSGFAAGTYLSSRLCSKLNRIQLLRIGCAACIVAASSMLLLACFRPIAMAMAVATIIVPMTLYMIGTGILYPSGFSGGISCFPEKSGATSSLTFTMHQGVAGIIATFGAYLHIANQTSLAIALLTLALLSLTIIVSIKE
jgi:MFS transporter, DHA1 family, multidrug resistance protein